MNDIENQFNLIEDEVKKERFTKFLNDLKSKVDKNETFDGLINIADFISTINKKKKNIVISELLFEFLEKMEKGKFNIYMYESLATKIGYMQEDTIVIENDAQGRYDLHTAFKYNYSKGNFFDKFKLHLFDCVTKWISYSIHTPIAVLTQSSGHGKSRLMKEFSNEEICLYLNLQNAVSTGFPKRSKLADDFLSFLNTIFKAEHILFCFISTALDLYNEIKIKNNGKSKEEISRDFVSHQPWFDENEIGSNSYLFNQKVHELLNETKHYTVFNLADKFSTIMGENSLFVFIDEAAALLDPVFTDMPVLKLHNFRKAVQKLFRNLKIVFIVADTNSKITNFIPITYSIKNDSKNSTFKPAHSPFYSSFFIDKLEGQSDYLKSLENYSYENLNERNPDKTVFCLGRPLWQSLFSAGASYNEVVEVAISKLISASRWCETKDFPRDFASLAVFSVRTTISLGYNSKFGPELVSRYMATLFYINDERSETAFHYFSEPILAQGMQQKKNYTLNLFIKFTFF